MQKTGTQHLIVIATERESHLKKRRNIRKR